MNKLNKLIYGLKDKELSRESQQLIKGGYEDKKTKRTTSTKKTNYYYSCG